MSHPEQEQGAPINQECTIQSAHHCLTLLPEMEAMLKALTADIEAAKERVWIETYIYRDDQMGNAFSALMESAAARGVDVRLIYDPQGSQKTNPSFFEALKSKGIQTRPYRPLGFWSWVYGPRAHSRVVVIDGAAYTGGAAWGDEWLPRFRGGAGWHDVCVRVEGGVVEGFQQAFERHWKEAKEPGLPALDQESRFSDVELIVDSPEGRPRLLDKYRTRIQSAKRRVWIENSYMFPPVELRRDLFEAAQRGVDVKLLLPRETDLPLIRRAVRAEYLDWLKRGLPVYEYEPSVLHAKIAVIDDDFAAIGSFNANLFSVYFSNDVSLFVFDAAFVERVAQLLLEDFSRSQPIAPEDIKRLPLYTRVYNRLTNRFLRLLELYLKTRKRYERNPTQ